MGRARRAASGAAGAGAALGGRGGLWGDAGCSCGGRGVGFVAHGLAGEAAGLGAVGQGGQGVADRAGRAAEVFGDLADRVRAGAGGEPLGNLAAKLAVAEPARGRGGNSGGGHREYLREKRGAGIAGGRALRHNRLLITEGNSPRNFLGTQRRYLAFSEAVNAFPPRKRRIPRRFPRYSSLTAPELITVRPRAFPAALAAFPRLPSPPPASSRACPHLAARPRAAGRARAGGHGPGGGNLVLNGYIATDKRQGINVRHACPARHLRLF